jgi:protease I
MPEELSGRRVAILAANGVEEVELVRPREAVTEAGATATLVSLSDGEIQAMNSDINPAGRHQVDRKVADVSAGDFDALILPGGTVNPDNLRVNDEAVAFVHDFVDSGKPVAAICHGPWTLIDAGVLNGRTLTSWPSIRTDLRNAGANVVDQEVVVDDNLITSRGPDDLPAFCSTIVKQFAA